MSAEVIRHQKQVRDFNCNYRGMSPSAMREMSERAFLKWQNDSNIFSLGHVYRQITQEQAIITALVFQIM